jgi:hypothetical protein
VTVLFTACVSQRTVLDFRYEDLDTATRRCYRGPHRGSRSRATMRNQQSSDTRLPSIMVDAMSETWGPQGCSHGSGTGGEVASTMPVTPETGRRLARAAVMAGAEFHRQRVLERRGLRDCGRIDCSEIGTEPRTLTRDRSGIPCEPLPLTLCRQHAEDFDRENA